MIVKFTFFWMLVLVQGTLSQPAATPDEIRTVQEALAGQRYDPGEPDGLFDRKTAAAIRQYQSDWRLPETGEISGDLIARLTRRHPATEPQWFQIENGDCMVWNPEPQAQETASWSGGCVNGKANGTGTLAWRYVVAGETKTGTSFEGELLDGKENGRGIATHTDGDRYEGEFRDSETHGRGVYTFANGDRYEGELRNSERNGHGVYTFANGDRFEGDYRDGLENGRGVYAFANGNRYEGEFRDGDFNGRGIFTFPNGNRYEGEFRDGAENGRGVYTLASGARYEGEFRNGTRHGGGIYTEADGGRFEGEYIDGKPHGYGTYTHDGIDYSGVWKDGCLTARSMGIALHTTLEACGF